MAPSGFSGRFEIIHAFSTWCDDLHFCKKLIGERREAYPRSIFLPIRNDNSPVSRSQSRIWNFSLFYHLILVDFRPLLSRHLHQ